MRKKKPVETTGIQDAIAKAGGMPSDLADLIGESRQRVEYWLKKGKVSGECCPAIAEKTGVPLHRLNPRFPENMALRA